MREITDSFTLSAAIDRSSARDNPAIARLIRTIVLRCRAVGAVVNPSSRLPRYAALFDLCDEGNIGHRCVVLFRVRRPKHVAAGAHGLRTMALPADATTTS
jgi:hypothetical protein